MPAAADLLTRAAGEIARLIHTGEVSSREVVEASFERIDEANPEVNAFIALDHDRALAAAAEVGPGDARPFAGQSKRTVDSLRIKAIRRFVENYEFGMRQERLGYAEPLSHSVGVSANRIVSAIDQIHQGERFLDSFTTGAAGHRRQNAQVVPAGKVFIEGRRFHNSAHATQRLERMLHHVVAEKEYTPVGGSHEPERHADHRRLSSAVLAQEPEDVAALN